MNYSNLSHAYFQHLKSIEEQLNLERLIDEKISAYMKEKQNQSKIDNQFKEELKRELKEELMLDIRRMVRESFRTEALNVRFKFVK